MREMEEQGFYGSSSQAYLPWPRRDYRAFHQDPAQTGLSSLSKAMWSQVLAELFLSNYNPKFPCIQERYTIFMNLGHPLDYLINSTD